MNTTDSLGRLTLNILLSFAQFERELIAERTRDKMRAARRKGKWLGGQPILGYDVAPKGDGLRINVKEAHLVRFIFQRIAEAQSGDEVLDELSRRGWTTKRWISRSGRQHPGRAFRKSDLIRLVKNVTYMGKVRDAETTYEGEHAAIVDAELWERANHAVNRLRKVTTATPPSRLENTTMRQQAGMGPPMVGRISRLMALALKMEQMIQEGAVKNYSDLARLGRVSPARITQVMNLLHLAPNIQEEILSRSMPDDKLRESTVRKLSSITLWREQRDRWRELIANPS